MSKTSVADWDTTAANNTDIGGISIAEGCAMANLNNAPREMMAQFAAWFVNPTPGASDGAALGSTSLMWSDLFLASGAVINFNDGDVTITHSANALAFAGASSGYSFDKTIILSSPGATAASAKATTGYTLANLNNAILDVGSGLLVINDHGSGQAAVFLMAGGVVTLIAQTATQFVATSPTTGQVGVFWNGSDHYYIGNAKGSTLTYGMFFVHTRSSV